MSKAKIFLPVALILVLVLAACSGGNQNNQPTGLPGLETGFPTSVPNTGATSVFPTAAPTEGMSTVVSVPTSLGTSGVSGTLTVGTSTPAAAATSASTSIVVARPGLTTTPSGVSNTPSVSGTQGVPSTGSSQLTKLSTMMNYSVVDANGNTVGTVRDYIINQCEAHLLYLVVDLNPSATASPTSVAGTGGSVLIPYEAFTVNPPAMVSQNSFVLSSKVTNLSSAPTVDINTIDLENPTWETNVLTYWRQYVNLTLTTGCNVPANGGTGAPVSGTVIPGGTPGVTGTSVPTVSGSVPTVPGTVPTVPVTVPTVPGSVPTVAGVFAPNTSFVAGTASVPAGSSTMVAGTPVTGFPTRTSNRVTVYRLALASQMLKANLIEGTGQVLGQVNDVMVVPNTGAILFAAIQPSTAGTPVAGTQTSGTQVSGTPVGGSSVSSAQTTQGLIALPDGAFTVRYIAGSTSAAQKQLVLVLLVPTSVYTGAPAYNPGTNTIDTQWFDYWNQYIPMTMSELP